jgi:hypothetical protein
MIYRSWLVLAILAPAPLHAAEAQTLSGASIKGELVSVTETEVRIRVDNERLIPTMDIVNVEVTPPGRPLPPTTQHLQVRLTDGTTLKCQAFGLAGKKASARLFSGVTVEFPAAAIQWLLCEAHDEKNHAEFEELLMKKPSQDKLRLLSRDGQAINEFDGFVGDADEQGENIEFTPDGGEKRQVAMNRVRGIVFARSRDANAPAAVCRLYDQFENVFYLHRIGTTSETYHLESPAGLSFELPKPLAHRFDFSLGKIAYLSDLDPVRLEETPILADLWHYRRDKNLEGEALSLRHLKEIKPDDTKMFETRTHRKGLALHSRTVIEYEVKGYNSFRCFLGIDSRVTGPAHAVVRFEGDGKLLDEQVITGKDAAKDMQLKVTGVSRLRITVDYGEDLDLGDHVILADARVMK